MDIKQGQLTEDNNYNKNLIRPAKNVRCLRQRFNLAAHLFTQIIVSKKHALYGHV